MRMAVDVRGLALVGRHPECRVALEVLHRAEAFPVSEFHVLDRHVVLQIDEGLLAGSGDMPKCSDRGGFVVRHRRGSGPSPEPEVGARRRPGPCARLAGTTRGRMRRSPRRRRVMPSGKPSGTKVESSSDQRGLAPWWVVSATWGFQPPDTASVSTAIRIRWPCLAHVDPRHAARAAVCIEHGRTEKHAGAALARSPHDQIMHVRARIDDRLHRHARRGQVGRRGPAVVGRGEHRDLAPGRHGKPVHVGADRGRHHHAGPVVAAEDDRPLDRPHGVDRAAGDDAPEPLARLVARRDGTDDRIRVRRRRRCRRHRRRRPGCAGRCGPPAWRRARPRPRRPMRRRRLPSISRRSARRRPPRRKSSSQRITRAPLRPAARAAARPAGPAPITSTSQWAVALS